MDDVAAVVKFDDQPYAVSVTALYCSETGHVLLMAGGDVVATMSPASAFHLSSILKAEAYEASQSLQRMMRGG